MIKWMFKHWAISFLVLAFIFGFLYNEGDVQAALFVTLIAFLLLIPLYGLVSLFRDANKFEKKQRDKEKQKRSNSSSSSSSKSSSSRDGYYTKKYSSKDISRLLSSNNLYACRFEDGSGKTRIDTITRAKIIHRNGSFYVELPDYYNGEYTLEHGHSSFFKGYCMWMNNSGDYWYLMDKDQFLILY